MLQPAHTLLHLARLAGGTDSLKQTVMNTPRAGFNALPLAIHYGQLVMAHRKFSSAAAIAPQTPESKPVSEMATELTGSLFTTGRLLFDKTMHLTPDCPEVEYILANMVNIRDKSADQASELSNMWLQLCKHQALRGDYDQSAATAQQALGLDWPDSTVPQNAHEKLVALTHWDGQGANPFGPEFDRAKRTQFIRQTGHSATRSFIKTLLVTTALAPVLTAMTATWLGVDTISQSIGIGDAGTAALTLGTVTAIGAGAILLGKTIMRGVDGLILPLAPQVQQAKKFTLSKVSGLALGVGLGLSAGYNLASALLPDTSGEPVYYKNQQTPPPQVRKPPNWQHETRFSAPAKAPALTI